ncbi:MAG: queuosine precursor transporter [Deltaproteobacteria bacterium]|nr:queuosine precursor transporter [Deltaproteobacteria bacterium]
MNDSKRNRQPPKAYSSYFVVLVALFVTSLIMANITAVKLIVVAGLILPAAVVIFPVSYIAGDVLTEVYGYSQARRVIWLGFFCNFVAVMIILLTQTLPPAPFWKGQAAYESILGYAPRLLTASFLAYLVGEFFNAYIMAKLKILTSGRWLWTRTLSSTLVGQGLDSVVFIGVAFVGTMPLKTLAFAVLTQWLVKVAYEAAATPLTYWAVSFLKRREGVDIYDDHTRFNPLAVRR